MQAKPLNLSIRLQRVQAQSLLLDLKNAVDMDRIKEQELIERTKKSALFCNRRYCICRDTQKKQGEYIGRDIVRQSGSFNLKTASGNTVVFLLKTMGIDIHTREKEV